VKVRVEWNPLRVGSYRLIGYENRALTDSDFVIETYNVGVFADGLCRVKKDGRWGYIDTDSATVIAPRFERATDFSEDVAAVKLNGLYGYINRYGDFAISPRFNRAYPFRGGLARVQVVSEE